MAKVRVSRVKTVPKGEGYLAHWGRRPPRHHWKVEQWTTSSTVRAFIYKDFHGAIKTADRLANWRPIYTYGLRGFHIEFHGVKELLTSK